MFNYVHMNVIFISYRLRGGIETRLIGQDRRSEDGLIDPNLISLSLMAFEYESNLLVRRSSEYGPYFFVVFSTLNAYTLVTNQSASLIYMTGGANSAVPHS